MNVAALRAVFRIVLLLGLGQLGLQALLLLVVWLRATVNGEAWTDAIAAVTTEPLVLGLAQLLALGLVVLLGRRVLAPEQPLRDALGLSSKRVTPLAAVAVAVVAGLALQLPLVEAMNLLADTIPALARPPERDAAIRTVTHIDGPIRALTVPLSLVIVPALTEEMLFRGLVLGHLRAVMPPRVAVVAVAVLFGAFHLEWLAFVYATLAGLVLGAVAWRAGTIVPAVALHAGFNALPVLLPPEIVTIDGFNGPGDGHVPASLVAASAALSAVALTLLVRLLPERRLEKDG